MPSGNGLVGIADRAGYPVLTVPAGYGTGGAGRNPIGVTFVGARLQRGRSCSPTATPSSRRRTCGSRRASRTRACGAASPAARSSRGELCHPGDRLITPTCTHGSSTGPTTVAAGETLCIRWGGAITGPLTVKAGATLKIDGGKISGPVTVTRAARWSEICGTKITGPLSVTGSTGLVTIGGDEQARVTATRSPARSR